MTKAECIALCLAMVMLHAGRSAAYPGYYAAKASNCTQIPATRNDLQNSPHGAPVANTDVTIEVRDLSSNSLATTICPGGRYAVTLKLPDTQYHSFITSTVGNFNDTCGGVSGCPNRACKCDASRSSGSSNCPNSNSKDVTYNIVMPCDAALKGTKNVFQAAFIQNSKIFGSMETITSSLNFGTDCPACDAGGGGGNSSLKLTAAKSVRLNKRIKIGIELRLRLPPGVMAAKRTVTLSWAPQDALSCTPGPQLLLPPNAASSITCKALKTGKVTVTAKDDQDGLTASRVINVRPAA